MTTYEEKLVAMEQQEREIDEQILALQRKKQELIDTAAELKRIEKENNFGLSKKEYCDLRRSLTILGETLSHKNVNFAEVTLVDDEPDLMKGGYSGSRSALYSFSLSCDYVNDFVMGFKYTVEIKTKTPGVRSLVRHMFRQKGLCDDEGDAERCTWSVDWDYHRSIEVVDPLDDDTFFQMVNNPRFVEPTISKDTNN